MFLGVGVTVVWPAVAHIQIGQPPVQVFMKTDRLASFCASPAVTAGFKLQALGYDILPSRVPLQWRNQIWKSLEEGAGKRCSECGLDSHSEHHSVSGTLLQTLPDLVKPRKGHTLSPRSCPATRSAPSERFGY